ncbi:hypothetical protein NL676_022615 [Syzygium grande]|nr:hypothetical protein NL676_022615 [Syzygium grande]
MPQRPTPPPLLDQEAASPPGAKRQKMGLIKEGTGNERLTCQEREVKTGIPKYGLTVEDGRRLMKEYSRVLMRRHMARQAVESNLLRMKKEAIKALPEKLREVALVQM